ASACAITFIIALVNDSLAARKKTAEARNPSSRPKPSTPLIGPGFGSTLTASALELELSASLPPLPTPLTWENFRMRPRATCVLLFHGCQIHSGATTHRRQTILRIHR